jgi:CheY-like chemotaxis protein
MELRRLFDNPDATRSAGWVAREVTAMIKVLVVDDSPLDRKISGGIVEAENAIVSYAENGLEALDKIALEKPDVVLTDMQMPVMDGLELVRRMKKAHSSIPVILVTRQGSEEVAVEALRIGASSYVPKRNLKRELGRTLDLVLSAAESLRERDTIRDLLQHAECYYVLGYNPGEPKALIRHLREDLAQANVGDETDRLRIGTALAEALANAIDHGNLELDSALRQNDLMTYRNTGNARTSQTPYSNRKVHVTARISPGEATFIVRDEGPGFDPHNLPDPTDPENITKPSGRGVMLIRTFMDDVRFSESGNEITMVKRNTSE